MEKEQLGLEKEKLPLVEKARVEEGGEEGRVEEGVVPEERGEK